MSNVGIDDVTVVMATRGPSPFFHSAVESAAAQRPAEVIVVENGTTGVVAEALPAGVRLLRLAAPGRSSARNTGVNAAGTQFVAFLDDDDLLLPQGLERLRTTLQHAADAPLAAGPVVVRDAAGNDLGEWNALLAGRFRRLSASSRDFAAILESRCPIYTSATMVRRDAFVAADGYDDNLESYEDLDLYLRLSRRGPVAVCTGAPVSVYRLHGSNTPSGRLYEGALLVTDKHLPSARGRERRLLVEWHIDALWGLRRFGSLRKQALREALRDPALLGRVRFTKRLLGSFLPAPILSRRG